MPLSSPNREHSHIYSESPASPSYISSSLPSTSPHSRHHQPDPEDESQGEREHSADSLADATEAQVLERVEAFFRLGNHSLDKVGDTIHHDGLEDKSALGLLNLTMYAPLDPQRDIPRSPLLLARPLANEPLLEASHPEYNAALLFLRTQVARLADTDWQYPTPDGFGDGGSSELGLKPKELGNLDNNSGAAGWMDTAFNLESYTAVIDEYEGSHDAYGGGQGEQDHEADDTTTARRFDDSMEDEIEEQSTLFGDTLSHGN